jgi:hypothetical protein
MSVIFINQWLGLNGAAGTVDGGADGNPIFNSIARSPASEASVLLGLLRKMFS